jgi:hypothetical protein
VRATTSAFVSRGISVNKMLRAASAWALMLLLASRAFGAEPEEPAPEAADADAAESAAEASSAAEDIDSAMAEEIRAAEEAAASAQPTDSNEAFVPSVQISEDLSVSFPVDI